MTYFNHEYCNILDNKVYDILLFLKENAIIVNISTETEKYEGYYIDDFAENIFLSLKEQILNSKICINLKETSLTFINDDRNDYILFLHKNEKDYNSIDKDINLTDCENICEKGTLWFNEIHKFESQIETIKTKIKNFEDKNL